MLEGPKKYVPLSPTHGAAGKSASHLIPRGVVMTSHIVLDGIRRFSPWACEKRSERRRPSAGAGESKSKQCKWDPAWSPSLRYISSIEIPFITKNFILRKKERCQTVVFCKNFASFFSCNRKHAKFRFVSFHETENMRNFVLYHSRNR